MRLRELRGQLGCKQSDIASALGIASNTYSQYETGARTPSPEMLVTIAKYFNVSVDYLLGVSDDSEQQKKPTGAATPDELFTDPVKKEALSIFSSLSPEDQQFFLDMMRHRANQ